MVIFLTGDGTIRCPACGFRVKAGEKSCEYCGYEFEQALPEMKGTMSDNASLQSEAYEEATRRVGGKRATKKKESKPKEQVEIKQAAEPVLAAETIQKASAADDPQLKIKKLEQQLREAEKELDEISKAISSAGPATQKDDTLTTHQVNHSFTVPTPPVQALLTHPPVVRESDNLSLRSSVHVQFVPAVQSIVAIVLGFGVYALLFALYSSLSLYEFYLVLVPATVLIASGIFYSFSEVQSRDNL
ncbi:MAG: zinc ribbon domain-containing protein [Methanomassiliicoccales archaeon]